jgi:hypothetical protein
MKSKIVLALFVVSLVFNVLALVVLVSAARVRARYISYNERSGSDNDYITSAAVVTMPHDGKSETSFGVIELDLVAGSKAHLQYSVMQGLQQSNWQLRYLYDYEVINIEYTLSGVLISAKAEGEASLQIVTQEGIKNVALVRVAASMTSK